MDLNEFPDMFHFLPSNHKHNQNQNQSAIESGSDSQPPPHSKKRSMDVARNNSNPDQPTAADGGRAKWMCQVEGCSEDGTAAQIKDYHRRHRVCPAHARAPSATLRGGAGDGGTLSRFCQQCSKFHALHEFDEDKRSCRRRLHRHNRRRRNNNNNRRRHSLAGFSPDEANAVVVALLHIVSLFESAKPDPARDQELIRRLLANLAASSPSIDISDLLPKSAAPTGNPGSSSNSELNNATAGNATDGRIRDFDLNNSLFQDEDNDDNEPEYEHENAAGDLGNISHELLQPTSNGDYQGRTGRVVFKLFGKGLADSPPNLHSEILTWLSHCPIEMESYMKPGCIVLTLYLCLPNSAWHELAENLPYWIERLAFISEHDFWRTGWVYVTLQDQMVFMYDGRLILEGPSSSRNSSQFQISSISPIAVSSAANVTFCVKGYGLSQTDTRFFVAYDGEYLAQGYLREFTEKTGDAVPGRPDEVQCIRFSCNIPASNGRGFIEIEEYDHRGISVPFIVTDDEPTRIEIRALESELNPMISHSEKNVAIEFLQDLGWLLRLTHCRRSDVATNSTAFPASQYRLLISFAMSREWCAVLKKLLDILFNEGINVHLDDCSSAEEFVLREGLLFEAVRRKSEPLVAFLLRYKVRNRYLFAPDMVGPCTNNMDMAFVTPLHLAATIDGAESVLDALTDDPGKIGIKAWTTSWGSDSRNKTPSELASERGHRSYIQMVQNKIYLISKNTLTGQHFDIEKGNLQCIRCMQQEQVLKEQVFQRSPVNGFLVNRPAVLTLVCIAAVCVCVGLILKTPPFVKYIKGPFLWDHLEKGTM